ncbi:MAG: STAS domain-containing protein [Desulfitobacteriaceae bacterium]|nr:STAS domain-containing protein [Desulfitobacteriaceae bacterium]MDD4346079.1 STAS domain-containing protein [Desulfitobacteriaceae bacterium]MDD4400906.1 STAS domain-containing protein [Desulfitobacteriaceae bacterium]
MDKEDKNVNNGEERINESTFELPGENSLLNAEIERVKKANKFLRENVEKYRAIIHSMDEGFCIIEMIFDSEGKPVDWRYLESNPAHEMYTRLKNVEGKLISRLAPKTELSWFELYGKVALTGEPMRIVEAALGGKICYDLYAFKIGGQDCRKVAVFSKDITERKKYEEQLKEQAQAIGELSTPVIQLWDGILALPLIGTIDSARVRQIMENLLNEIIQTKSSQVVIDITGVPVVDTGVASRLMRTVEAARLLGAECILTGISPVIAQTLVTVGVNLGRIKTRATLKNGLESALKNLNMRVTDNEK